MVVIDLILFSILLVVIDKIYLSWIYVPISDMVKHIQGSPMIVNKTAAVIVYISLIGAWYMFIYKDMKKYTVSMNITRATLLGYFIYSTFDFTNLAILKDYSLDIALIDSLWGGILFATTTTIFMCIKLIF
jgi:uncharacterized membrane protein